MIQCGKTPIDVAAARVDGGRHPMFVRPQRATGRGIKRDHIARRTRHVHDAVDDNRRGLHLLAMHLVDPLDAQTLDVLARDLLERAEMVTAVVAAVHQPVAWLLVRFEQAIVRDRETWWQRLRANPAANHEAPDDHNEHQEPSA